MHSVNTIGYIVGDKFDNLKYMKNILTFSDFIHQTVSKELGYGVWEVGLGLNEYELNILKVINSSVNNLEIIFPDYNRASKAYTHKVKHENVMITNPEKINDQLFSASLVPNDDCAEMSDHMTGKHVQGMVLIESARQMMLAVSERYLLADEDQHKMYCLLGRVDTHFKQFIFPIETKMICELKGLIACPGKKYKLELEVNFYQKEVLCTAISLSVSFHKKSQMENIESDLLGKMITLESSMLKKAVNHA